MIAARSKRLVLGLGISVVALSALMMGLWPTYAVVLIALVLQGVTGGFVGLAIPAVSLGLVGQPALAERLGLNQRFQSAGSLAAAGLMGALGYALSNRVIFFAAALLAVPALVALSRIRSAEVDYGRSVGVPIPQTNRANASATRNALDRSLAPDLRHLSLFVSDG